MHKENEAVKVVRGGLQLIKGFGGDESTELAIGKRFQ